MLNIDSDTGDLRQRFEAGDRSALEELFTHERERLRLMVALRLDRRLRGRLDPSDVIQEAFLEAALRFKDYARTPEMSPHLWLRFLTCQRLAILHRQHLHVQSRDAGREISFEEAEEVNSEGNPAFLADPSGAPSRAAEQAELQSRLQQALSRLSPEKSEVLALRHFSQLDNAEAAQVLGLKPGTTSHRYFRALKCLKEVLAGMPGGMDEE